MLLVAKVDVTVEYLGTPYPLCANEFGDGTVDPRGFVHLESFALVNGLPVLRYALADALLEQRIFMAPGGNTSYLRLEVLRAGAPLRALLRPLVTYRGYHTQGRGPRPMQAVESQDGCAISAGGEPVVRLRMATGHYAAADAWYWNYFHREEFARGLDALEDLWNPGAFSAELGVGQAAFFTASSEASEPAPGEAVLADLAERAQGLVGRLPRSAPPWVRSLATAADQFIVRRAAGASVIAGYPWFADWGRDTMIALPGLTTVLGRFDTSAAILRTYAGVVDRGMLPNRFADAGEALEFNTVDAALWMFQAVSEHLDAKRDPELLRDLFPVLAAIIHAHVEGTRFGIQMDPADGLIRAGEPGMQLTWMDAKQGARVFTPRIGKPVEINALWLNALEVTGRLAGRVRNSAEKRYCQALLKRATDGYARFWNPDLGCLYDVIDVDGGAGHDASVRPNQIFAVSLPYSVLPQEQMRAVVDTCARELLTSYGLRSLSSRDPAYLGRYAGNAWQRDAAYHQGTVWSWLLGPFARAHYRVYGDALQAQAILAPIAQHVAAACLGSVGEVFDGDAPHSARGCFAQAWSVAEILRTWLYLDHKISNQ
jgi:predicted glycogen debranching enzyme